MDGRNFEGKNDDKVDISVSFLWSSISLTTLAAVRRYEQNVEVALEETAQEWRITGRVSI